MTLGPIVLAACPGTGSFWLQQVLTEPDGCGLGRGPIRTMVVRPAIAFRWDRHAPGPCTCTIIRNVDELLRSWFMRFRKKPPPHQAIAHSPDLLHPGNFLVYLGEINTLIGYWGPDFKTWLDAYLTNATGEATKLLGRFTEYAIHTLHQENLLEETIGMLRYENVEFDEDKVRAYPKINQAKKETPPWPDGYAEKIIEAG